MQTNVSVMTAREPSHGPGLVPGAAHDVSHGAPPGPATPLACTPALLAALYVSRTQASQLLQLECHSMVSQQYSSTVSQQHHTMLCGDSKPPQLQPYKASLGGFITDVVKQGQAPTAPTAAAAAATSYCQSVEPCVLTGSFVLVASTEGHHPLKYTAKQVVGCRYSCYSDEHSANNEGKNPSSGHLLGWVHDGKAPHSHGGGLTCSTASDGKQDAAHMVASRQPCVLNCYSLVLEDGSSVTLDQLCDAELARGVQDQEASGTGAGGVHASPGQHRQVSSSGRPPRTDGPATIQGPGAGKKLWLGMKVMRLLCCEMNWCIHNARRGHVTVEEVGGEEE